MQRTLNREDKASEGQLLPKRFNLTLGTQRSTNSKLKMAHRESVTFSKYPRPENCIVSSVNGEIFNSLKHMIVVTKHTLNRHNYMEKHSLQLRQP